MNSTFFGKYRGIVTDTADPLKLGRLRAQVPDVTGEHDSGWAMPCVPFAGAGVGLFYLPPVGSGVWIEFEQGDPDYPIWSGCYWPTASDLPSEVTAAPDQTFMLKTVGGHYLLLDDSAGSGGITLQTAGGQKIAITAQGITIDNGNGATVKLDGPKISLNDSALEVT